MTLLTPENVAAARAARSARIEHWKANASQLKQDFADEAHWRRLASRFGVRMPSAYVPGSELRLLRRAAKRAGISGADIWNTLATCRWRNGLQMLLYSKMCIAFC